ncbi:CRISPR-associated endonuclease Cas2 [[Phormidium ambiguum] IAM M-71]|uniref:CRISPR-associated endoribonuclease Cas2 n=1 Tax=[Phormidium ambiguum] IAM M-71 TaxID=454136 RepID=A0A1U7IB28_9CYAN|nr:CRISPR-associated endonuclease Cas2 [Phormidium ambiguum]OKH33827.1 CRISPR-associated endonuclease Cas2 [Phormidium ambiguum IAM M-71]
MLFYVIVYDIPDDKRRQKVANLLEGYGKRVQYSVFECILTAEKYKELGQRLRKRVKISEDSVRFYPLSGHTLNQIETWGGCPITQPPSSTVI